MAPWRRTLSPRCRAIAPIPETCPPSRGGSGDRERAAWLMTPAWPQCNVRASAAIVRLEAPRPHPSRRLEILIILVLVERNGSH